MSSCCRRARPMSPSRSALRMRENATAVRPSTVWHPGACHTRPESGSLIGKSTLSTAGSKHRFTPPTASTISATPPSPTST